MSWIAFLGTKWTKEINYTNHKIYLNSIANIFYENAIVVNRYVCEIMCAKQLHDLHNEHPKIDYPQNFTLFQ